MALTVTIIRVKLNNPCENYSSGQNDPLIGEKYEP